MRSRLGCDRELDGSSKLECDLRTSRFQEGSSESLDELRTRLGFRVFGCGRRFWFLGLEVSICLRDLETIVLITCCKKMGNCFCVLLMSNRGSLYKDYKV